MIWNTIQAFLRGSKVALENELEISRENSFHYGVKLVRGAYIEGERLLAERHNWPNPVWPTKSQTRVSARRNSKVLNVVLSVPISFIS